MDKTGQLFNIFDPVAFKIFKKIIHNKSLPAQDKSLQVLKDNLLSGSKNKDPAYPPEVMTVYGNPSHFRLVQSLREVFAYPTPTLRCSQDLLNSAVAFL